MSTNGQILSLAMPPFTLWLFFTPCSIRHFHMIPWAGECRTIMLSSLTARKDWQTLACRFYSYIFGLFKTQLRQTLFNQVLAILLNHEPSPLIMRHGAAKNIFVEYLRSIDQVSEFEWIYEAVHQLLSNPIRAHSTYLPNSTKQVSCHQEVLMFFWKLIQENQVNPCYS